MKFNITVDGGYKVDIDIIPDDKGCFTGTFESADYGGGTFTDGVKTGNELKGKVALKGYNADFTATISSTGTTITGELSYSWLFHKKFTGVSAAT